mmetsp:Transcript_19396/g.44440  ORF Transcript_19396/g.44440 Transcript_19396/m.44440 type:complete len:101 (-) Transcript_19396:119-421(-)
MFELLDVCGIPGIDKCIQTSQRVVDGHYPHVMPHSSNLKFWEQGLTSDIGKSFLIGHKKLGNSTELQWEGLSRHVGSAGTNSAVYKQMYAEGQRAQWGSF